MEESVRAYARLRLERAREDLATARDNIGQGYFRAAVNRAYYAVFHMASAALFSQGIQRSKHSGIESAFSQFLVKPGYIEPEFSRFYQQARRQREEADYAEMVNIDQTTAQQTVTNAERFVSRVEQFLQDTNVL